MEMTPYPSLKDLSYKYSPAGLVIYEGSGLQPSFLSEHLRSRRVETVYWSKFKLLNSKAGEPWKSKRKGDLRCTQKNKIWSTYLCWFCLLIPGINSFPSKSSQMLVFQVIIWGPYKMWSDSQIAEYKP